MNRKLKGRSALDIEREGGRKAVFSFLSKAKYKMSTSLER
jgi:hypothetical protein